MCSLSEEQKWLWDAKTIGVDGFPWIQPKLFSNAGYTNISSTYRHGAKEL